MADGNFDNTNRGALFPPYDDQRMILSGKLNVEGDDQFYVVVSRQDRKGNIIRELYRRAGVLFEQTDKRNENAPDYTGPLDQTNLRVAAWRRDKDGRPYLSLKVSEIQRREDGDGAGGDYRTGTDGQHDGGYGGGIEDEIPF